MSPRPVFLDVDPTIVEHNLKITEDRNEDEFNKLFPSPEEYPSKVVKPFPGFCIKTKEVGSEIKIFVNICQTDAIPAPEEISDERLLELMDDDSDEPTSFRVPMSIGVLQTESDKKGNEAKKVDVAINPKFLYKVENSAIFKSFFVAVAFEGIRNKHQLLTTDDRIILKNRKAYGELQLHRVQQREIAEKMGISLKSGNSPIEELRGRPEIMSKPKIETLSSVDFVDDGKIIPKYRLFKKIGEPNFLIGEFKLPYVVDASEVTLDIGEDRIVLESIKGYFLDVFVPCSIKQDQVLSTFNKGSKILTITMPINLEAKIS